MKELNAQKGGLGGLINAEALENKNVLSVIITSILSKYYVDKRNQLLIDEFLDSSFDDIFKDLGYFSYGHVLENLLVNLEKVLNNMK